MSSLLHFDKPIEDAGNGAPAYLYLVPQSAAFVNPGLIQIFKDVKILNVLILNLAFYPRIGGVENSIRTLCEIYSKRGDDVTVVSADIVDTTGIRYPDNEFLFGARIRRFKKNHKLTYIYSCYSLLKEVKKKENFDLVISRSHITTYLAEKAGFKDVNYLIPGIVKNQGALKNPSIHEIFPYARQKFNEFVQSIVFKNNKKNFVFSDTMYQQVKKICPESSVYKVQPGCDENRFYPSSSKKFELREQYGLPKDQNILLVVGRLMSFKGFKYAVESLVDLPKNYTLLVVGDGPEYNSLLKLAEDIGVSERVFFIKKCTNPEYLYRLSDAFIFTSLYEPFGQVLLEAVFSGLKVVAFDPESIEDVDTATKQIFEGFDSLVKYVPSLDGLAETIISEEDDFKQDAAAMARFKIKYSWSALVNKLDKVNASF